MADSGEQHGSKRVRQPTARARVADERGRAQSQPTAAAAQLLEADQLIKALHELILILASSRPDRRSIAFAAASLRGELTGQPSDQAAFFSLSCRGLRNACADWVDDDDARLRQALSYVALTPAQRAAFFAERASRPSEEELAQREASKRQRLDDGARPPLPHTPCEKNRN